MIRVLRLAQRFSFVAIAFLSVIAVPRELLLEVTDQPNIPLDFRAITLSRPDYPLLLLLLLTGIRLAFDAAYPRQLGATARLLWVRFGGLLWLALVLWMGASLLWARQPIMTRFVALHAFLALVMALILADMVRHEGDHWLLPTLAISSAIQSIIAILQSIAGAPLGLSALGEIERFSYDPVNFYRASGLSQHANYLGGYLVVCVFACVLLVYRTLLRRDHLILPAIAGVLCTVGVFTTLSRSAILGLAVGMLPLAWVLLRRLSYNMRLLLFGIGATAAIISAAIIFVATRGDIATRFFTGREFFFEDSWAEITNSPILGTGAGNLMLNIGPKRGGQVPNLLPVHNVYLYIWGETGLVGMLLFVAGCAVIWWRLRAANVQAFLWGGAFLAISVIMLFDNYWWGVHPFQLLFFWVIGLWWGLASGRVPSVSTPTA